MNADETPAAVTSGSEPFQTDQNHEFLLAGIIRKRRRPLLLLIDEDGELLYSSLPDEAPPAAHRLLGQALAEAKTLFQSQFQMSGTVPPADGDQPGERSALVILDSEFYSVRLFPLHQAAGEEMQDQYAALVEPIVGPLSDEIDFSKVKERYRLSNREIDVLEALMSGSKDKEIARALGVTAGTVRAYLKSIRAKLRVTTRTAVVNLVHEFSGDGRPTSN